MASLFLLGGINKIANFEATAARMTEVGLSPASALLPAAIALELGAGLLLAIGRWGSRPAALALALFTLATNIYFHNFWTLDGDVRALELSLFFKNVAIAGALLMFSTQSNWRPRMGTSRLSSDDR